MHHSVLKVIKKEDGVTEETSTIIGVSGKVIGESTLIKKEDGVTEETSTIIGVSGKVIGESTLRVGGSSDVDTVNREEEFSESLLKVQKEDPAPTCLRCGQRFEDRRSLFWHRCPDEMDGRRKKNKQCPHCDYRAASSSYLTTHVAAMHLKLRHSEKPHECPHCHYRTIQPGGIKRHVTAVHLGEKPHKCPHCQYRAAQLCNIKRHVTAAHLGQKPHNVPTAITRLHNWLILRDT